MPEDRGVTDAITIPLWVDLLAISVAGAQGALLAADLRDRQLDLLGVAIVGTATALGGGFLRDVLLGITPAACEKRYQRALKKLKVYYET